MMRSQPWICSTLFKCSLKQRNVPFCAVRCFHTSLRAKEKEAETDLVKQLKARIKATGPMSVSDYMKEVLTNPTAVSKYDDI